ncbi:HEAT repeat domain-containing protein [Nitrospira moscoviensis]|uniref:HEAT repeat domain-containing protein n=1 Tax=Nitrospira moscoviensis TaxID=42253 RepID=UPI000AAFCFF8|nr:HEAT repeat domain-containing protein [Nitrospira moscoviensis]
MPGLIDQLEDEDATARILAAQWLAKLGSDAKDALPKLVEAALRDSNQDVSAAAGAAIHTLDLTAARDVVSGYLPALWDPAPEIRRKACVVLGSLGPVAKPAVPSLITMLDDTDDLVRERAVGALGSIGIPQAEIVAAVTHALHDPAAIVRYRAAAQFAFHIPVSAMSVPALLELRDDKEKSIASLAEVALEHAGRNERQDVSHLVALLERPGEKDYALQQLAQLGPKAADAAPVLISVLKDSLALNRYLAAEALRAIGPAAEEAVPELIVALHDPDPIVTESAAEALEAIGTPDALKALEPLRREKTS